MWAETVLMMTSNWPLCSLSASGFSFVAIHSVAPYLRPSSSLERVWLMTVTSAPIRANRAAIALPRPEPPPVMSARRPESSC